MRNHELDDGPGGEEMRTWLNSSTGTLDDVIGAMAAISPAAGRSEGKS